MFSSLFTIVLSIVMIVVYSLFEQFRAEEFKTILQEKAETTVKLLLEVNEVDSKLLNSIDKNTINQLYNSKTLVFDDSLKLIYSTNDNEVLVWTKTDLDYLKNNYTFFKRYTDKEVFGGYYDNKYNDYYVIVKAEDVYGLSKLEYLKYLLIASYIISNLLVWIISIYLSKISLDPLLVVTNKIKEITDKNLNVRLIEGIKKDEINDLSHSFNQMLDRIETAYRKQKEFTANASHELRTPISRIVTQLENIISKEDIDLNLKNTLISISEDSYQLSELVSSLLLLSKLDDTERLKQLKKVRVDEIIFASADIISKSHPDFKLSFEIVNSTDSDPDLEIKADDSILKIAFVNIFKNAYLYSIDKHTKCTINLNNNKLSVSIMNKGEHPKVEDPTKLFQAFYRGSNSQAQNGSGLGLGICKRIIEYHDASIKFNLLNDNINEVLIVFQLS